MSGQAFRLTDAVILTGDAVAAVAEAVRVAQHARKRDGLLPSMAWARLEVVLAGPVAEVGQTDSPDSPVGEHGYMDAAAAAELLGCSERTARRLAPKLGGQKRAGVWLIDSIAVREHLDGSRESS